MSTQPPPENHWHRDEAAGLECGEGSERPEPPARAWVDRTDRRQVAPEMNANGCFLLRRNGREEVWCADSRTHTRRICNRQGGAKFG